MPTGRALTYRFAHRHASRIALPLPSGAAAGVVEADIDVESLVRLRRLGPDRLGFEIASMPRHRMRIAERDLLPTSASVEAELLDHRAEVQVGADSSFEELSFERDAPLMFRRFAQLFFSEVHLTLPERPGWEWSADEPTTNGTAVGTYRFVRPVGSPVTLSRDRAAYRDLRVLDDRASDADLAVSGDAMAKVDDRGVVRMLRASDSLEARDDSGELLSLTSSTELELEDEQPDSAPPEALRTPVAQALDAVITSEGFEERTMERRAREMSAEELLEGLEIVATIGKMPSHDEWFSRGVARLRAEPELTREFVPLYHGRNSKEGREVLLDLLVWAGHETAQEVLVELVSSDTTRQDPYAAGFVQRLSFVQYPTEATLRYLEERAFAGSEKFDTAHLYALGSAAGNARSQTAGRSASRAEAAIGALVRALERADDPARIPHLISALGNARAVDHVALIATFASAPEPEIRRHVASSLRDNPSPLARETLVALAADPVGPVQRRALAVLQKKKSLDDNDLRQLRDAVADSRIEERSLALVVNVVAPYTRRTPVAAEVLRAVIARPFEGEPSLKWRAGNLLNHPRTLR